MSSQPSAPGTASPSPVSLRPEVMTPLLANFQGTGFRENESERRTAVAMRGNLLFAAADAGPQLHVYASAVPAEFRNGEYIAESQIRSERYIEDEYALEITFSNGEFPVVKEIGGRTKAISEKARKSMSDLHTNLNGSCCLCVPHVARAFMKKPDAPEKFIPEMVVPFFYRLSCVEKDIPLPQWGEHKHELEGLLEFYQQAESAFSGDEFAAFLDDVKCSGREGLLKFYRRFGKELSRQNFNVFRGRLDGCIDKKRDVHRREIFEGREKFPGRSKKKIPIWEGMTLSAIAKRCRETPAK